MLNFATTCLVFCIILIVSVIVNEIIQRDLKSRNKLIIISFSTLVTGVLLSIVLETQKVHFFEENQDV